MSARRLKPLPILEGDQRRAADPQAHAALSASAGTGKTQVLTARVLRLLLADVPPETILCLTFTKAGAAEMTNRLSERLAAWVRMPKAALRKELFALGEDHGPAMLERARRLFARVLEAPGGLRVQTIHAFAQALLAAFPAEAGVPPGFEPIEGRAEQQLARRTLAELAAEAEAAADEALIADLQALSMRLGEGGTEKYLHACAGEAESFAALPAREAIGAAVRAVHGLPEGDIELAIVERLRDDRLDSAMFDDLLAGNRGWGTGKKAIAIVANLERFLAATPAERVGMLAAIGDHIVKADGEPCAVATGQRRGGSDYDRAALQFCEWRRELLMMRVKAALAEVQAAGLRAGQAYAAAYVRAKRAAGVADFGDLIRWTRALLEQPGMGAWVRFKLDQQTDHILVDEAQDTNADQWSIVRALSDEYFSGASESEERWRTLFMVGDFKQAIFRFQGTDPREYESMRGHVRALADALDKAARETGGEIRAREFRDLSIATSFRSSQAVLDVVDAVIGELGHGAMGLPDPPARHVSFRPDRPGRVEWWPAFERVEDEEEEPAELGEEGWLGKTERAYAGELARTIKSLVDEAPVLASTGRPLAPGDVLVLVRSRGELASLIVARLFAERVPVAGIDRLHLHRPLAVNDLLAAVGFAVQPDDDLNLANLLVSPLIGWDQQQLYDVARERRSSLWRAVQERAPTDPALTSLGQLLAMADYTTPSQFLETILSGPIDGRRKLLRRLGAEARDPIEELVSAAIEFERSDIASLDRFLAWFGSGEVEIKRDPSAPANAVRVMTVHGAKGLEAPVVILADATADPAKLGPGNPPVDLPVAGRTVPLVAPKKAERTEPFTTLIENDQSLDLAEHWRLLYVGLTRAAEHLVVAGIRKRGEAADSWHKLVERAMATIGAERDEDSGRLVFEQGAATNPRRRLATAVPAPALPGWLRAPAPVEARPPRPLAPSAQQGDEQPYPPPSPALAAAARRGVLLHRLFERLPGVAPAERAAAARAWLEQSAGVDDAALRDELVEAACAIIADPRFAAVFSARSLAEAPIAAALPDGRVIVGTVDRLLVEDNRVTVVDFKTGQFVPAGQGEVPPSHAAQMAAYGEALAAIFPGRRIERALLYTAGPSLVALDH